MAWKSLSFSDCIPLHITQKAKQFYTLVIAKLSKIYWKNYCMHDYARYYVKNLVYIYSVIVVLNCL